MDVPWRIALFGGLRAERGGQVVARFRTQKTGALLAYLAYHLHHSHPRDLLIELLWPEADPEAGSHSLSTALSWLRHLLEEPDVPPGTVLVTDRSSVRLNPEAVSTDVAEFEAALHAAAGSEAERREGLARAVTLYRGELLTGSYENWVLGQREWLAETYFQALGRLVTLLEGEGDLARALEYARPGVLADPLREEARRDLMRLYAAAGQPEAALRQYQELTRLLKEQLDAQPSGPTRALARQIEADPAALLAPPPLSPPPAPGASLRPPGIGEAASGTRTFLLTDVEGSTSLWEEHPEAMAAALARHDALAAAIVAQRAGTLVKHRGEGDSLFAVFPGACDGVAAALALQRALWAERWPEEIALRVRMALHTGDAVARDGDYLGGAVNRCARLRAAAPGGQVLLSRATQELVAEQLPEGVGLRDLGECHLRDLVRLERVFQLLHADLPGNFPPLQSLTTRPNNLPAQSTPLIGREVELAAVGRLLRREEVRLVTLTGPGGTGKTRLGLQIGAELLEEFADGVFFVDVAPIRDPERVVATIAQALGVREVPGQALGESLKELLREKQLLLLLDNFEQVLAAAPRVAELLAGAPRLKMLVTSRAILRLRGEHDFPVAPLALPDRQCLPDRDQLCQYAAVALFIQRAVAAQPEFAVTNENAPAVAEICHRLDGLPLAIELAAARARLLSPEVLLSRLERRLPLLTGGARDLPERQQTLRAAIGWSYDLLAEGEQRLFRRLSVFVGGCSLEAAEAVCRAEGDLPIDLLEGIGSLVDQSLLRQQEPGEGVGTGEPRFGMLETIREYGQECLEASGEEEAAWRRHAQFFLALAEQGEAEWFSPQQEAWIARWEREHANLRAALSWAKEKEEEGERAEIGLRLAGSLWRFWSVRGDLAEGRERLESVLSRSEASGPTVERARALDGAGLLAMNCGDFTSACALYEEALSIGQELGDKRVIATARNNLGDALRYQGDAGAARSLYEEALRLGRELNDRWNIAYSLTALGIIASTQGDYGAARSLFEEGLSIKRALGDKRSIAYSLSHLANMALEEGNTDAGRSLYEESLRIRQGLGDKRGIAWSLGGLGIAAREERNFGAARARFEESLAIFREVGDKNGIAWSLSSLGIAAREQGEYGAARALLEESLAVFRELGNKGSIVMDLEGLAAVAVPQGQPERAAHLFGAAEALHEVIGAPLPPAERAEHDRSVAAVRAALGEEAFAAAWAAGRALTIEQAVAEALAE